MEQSNLIYQFGEQSKAETRAELTATTKRRKLTERDHSIRTRLAKAKEQTKQPTVAEGEQTALLYTRDKAVMRKLDTFVADFPRHIQADRAGRGI